MLSYQMTLTRKFVEVGRAARALSKTKTRHPLPYALIWSDQYWMIPPEFREIIKDEINVLDLWSLDGNNPNGLTVSDFFTTQVQLNYKDLGSKLGSNMPLLKKAVELTGTAYIEQELKETGFAYVETDTFNYILNKDDVNIVGKALSQPDCVSVADNGIFLVLGTNKNSEAVRLETIYADLVHDIMEIRKQTVDLVDYVNVGVPNNSWVGVDFVDRLKKDVHANHVFPSREQELSVVKA